MALQQSLLLIHLLAAAGWIGGMATMLFAVRPSLPLIEAPPQRVAYMAAVFARLFAAVAVAIVLLFASGLGLVAGAGGWAAAHWSVHVMATLAIVMAVVFGVIRFGPFAALRRAVAAAQWPVGAACLGRIRTLVALNLAIGVLVFAVATLGRAF
jgi:uncharacterized membrane protein